MVYEYSSLRWPLQLAEHRKRLQSKLTRWLYEYQYRIALAVIYSSILMNWICGWLVCAIAWSVWHNRSLLSPARGEDSIRTATPPYGGGWEGLYVKIKNGDYKRQEEQKTEVLNDVTEEHTKSTQKILKPPKIPIGFVVFLLLLLGLLIKVKHK